MFAIEYKHRLYHAILDFLWRQWNALGIPGHLSPAENDYVIDPEALLLFSAHFCRYDARLYDLVVDWLRTNGALISVQRLNALAKKFSKYELPSLGYMAQRVADNGERRWKKLASDLRPASSLSLQPLFVQPDGTQNDFIRTKDQIALQFGYLRNDFKPSMKVSSCSHETPAAFLLQLRGAFGLSARAETILILLTRDVCKIQDIAELSAFSWKSIQDSLEELCASSLVIPYETKKRGKSYVIRNQQTLLTLFGHQRVRFPRWESCFRTIVTIWETLSNPRLATVSEETVLEELREAFQSHIGDSLLYSGLDALKSIHPTDIIRLPECLAEI